MLFPGYCLVASLLPHVEGRRGVTVAVAVAVVEAPVAEGLATVRLQDMVGEVEDAI